MSDEKWDVKLTFEVEGKETYINTSEWKNIKPEKVAIMEGLLGKLQEEWVKRASKV